MFVWTRSQRWAETCFKKTKTKNSVMNNVISVVEALA